MTAPFRPELQPGEVALVGAGPGDPDLLTLRAARFIASADLLLVDDLVGAGVLSHASAQCRIVSVGKRGGCRSTPQEFIERLMLRAARRKLRVVRLKGGDPGIFGRGGEELARLRAAGITVHWVSGISAGTGAAQSLGFALTHRAHTAGVSFVTAHSQHDIDWEALVRSRMTLVVYMGVARLGAIRDALLAAGLPADTPVAAVQDATRAQEQRCLSCVGQLVEAVGAAGLRSPCVLVIGEVVREAQAFAQPMETLQRLAR